MSCAETQTFNKTTIGLDIIELDSNLANLTAAQMFDNFFGLTPSAYRAAMLDDGIELDVSNGDDFDSVVNLAQNKIIWHEGDASILGGTVGYSVAVTGGNTCSAANEATSIVIINGNVSLSGNSTVHGAMVVAGVTNNTGGSLDIWYNSGLLKSTQGNGPMASASGLLTSWSLWLFWPSDYYRSPQIMGKVLGIVYRTLATHITNKAGYNKQTAQTGAVTLIQRFGSTLNLNIRFHILLLDGVYAEDDYGKTRLDDEHPCSPPYRQPAVVLLHSPRV